MYGCHMHKTRWPSPQPEQQGAPAAGAVSMLVLAGLQEAGGNDAICWLPAAVISPWVRCFHTHFKAEVTEARKSQNNFAKTP